MNKEISVLKKLSKQSKRDFNKVKKLKIKVKAAKELNDNDRDLLRLAEIHPTNTKLQQMKIRMLKKNNLLEHSELSQSVSSGYSGANSDNTPAFDLKKLVSGETGPGQTSTNSVKVLDKINTDLDNCKNNEGIFNPQKVYEMMNKIQKQKDPEAYRPEMEKTVEQREKQLKKNNQLKAERQRAINEKLQQQEEHERALFDFD